jgi:thiol-disulfide isomerase/thioredoxin
MLALGIELPSFALPDLDGHIVTDQDFAHAAALVVAFLCPHCPYVKHVRRTFAEVATAYQARDVAVVAINPNDPTACVRHAIVISHSAAS